MPISIAGLLRKRDRLELAVYQRIQPLWPFVQQELGIAPECRTDLCLSRLELEGAHLGAEIDVRVPPTSWEKEARRSTQRVLIPLAAFDGDQSHAAAVLRSEYPLICSRCGLFHRTGTRQCNSAAKCWGMLTWRREAPQPRYYVEAEASYGYVVRNGPRKLRYAIELSTQKLFGVQVTLPRQGKWTIPVSGTLSDIAFRVATTVATDILDAANGHETGYADPACLSLAPPDWCSHDEREIRLHLGSRRTQQLLA
jgi:hypothetical protein